MHVLRDPNLRGKFRYCCFESVVREAENLAQAGVREISLIGQDTTFTAKTWAFATASRFYWSVSLRRSKI